MKITINRTDGSSYDVETCIADQVAYSEARQRRKWPTVQEDPLLFQNYLAFVAARRTGQHTGTWAEFGEQTESVDADDDELADPI